MPRSFKEIDSELARAVTRRVEGRKRISILSECIVADTRLIDLLLAERSDAEALQLAGAPRDR